MTPRTIHDVAGQTFYHFGDNNVWERERKKERKKGREKERKKEREREREIDR